MESRRGCKLKKHNFSSDTATLSKRLTGLTMGTLSSCSCLIPHCFPAWFSVVIQHRVILEGSYLLCPTFWISYFMFLGFVQSVHFSWNTPAFFLQLCWDIIDLLCKFKVYNVFICYTYILQNGYHHAVS